MANRSAPLKTWLEPVWHVLGIRARAIRAVYGVVLKRLLFSIFAISLVLVFAYAWHLNLKMYKALDATFSSDPIFKKAIGTFEKATLLASDSACGFRDHLSCSSESYLELCVSGSKGAVLARAFVYESFPIYRFLSVEPVTYTSSLSTSSSSPRLSSDDDISYPTTTAEIQRCPG